MTRIRTLTTIPLYIPFDDGGSGEGITPSQWSGCHTVLVRVEDEDGITGWGEAFAYFCQKPVEAAINDMIAPLVIGREIEDIGAWNLSAQRALHLFGRYGLTVFALSGVDIALWDLKAKRAGKSLAALLGRDASKYVHAYASLVRYGTPDLVARFATRARRDGFAHVKLHEIMGEAIAAARPAIGGDIGLMVDVNCAWTAAKTEALAPLLREARLSWLEEPIFPPEDYRTLRRLEAIGIPIGCGENACTAFEFTRILRRVTYAQPSVTKVGGVSVFRNIADDAVSLGKVLMPHSPYFGPGYFATLQLFALLPPGSLFEYLYVNPRAWVGLATPRPKGGRIVGPVAPGLGFEPDPETLELFSTRD